jgi:hypothetical protein
MTPIRSAARTAKRTIGIAFLTAGAACVFLAAPAFATEPAAAAASNSVPSQNWSGYAAHGDGAKFSTVSAHWRMPAADCVKGEQSFSSFWVGIGGYSLTSTALEQDGAELDCNADGTESLSAWYELLPAGPHTVKMTVKAGDLISATVHVVGHEVTMKLSDLTRHESFSKTVTASDIDTSSAEWITEAPSDCSSDTNCTVLALADFGAVRFSNATATTTAGNTSGIKTAHWTTTKLLLGYEKKDTEFIADSSTANATPSALTADSTAFEVTWSGTLDTPITTTTTTTSTGAGGQNPGNPGGFGSGGDGPGGGNGPGGPGFSTRSSGRGA